MTKKKAALISLILCISLGMTACMNDGGENDNTSSEPTTKIETPSDTDTNDNSSDTITETESETETESKTEDANESISNEDTSKNDDSTQTKEDDTTDIKDEDIKMAEKVEKTFNTQMSENTNGSYTTSEGLSYTASGHINVNNNKFNIGGGTLTLRFNSTLAEKYNKFILCYEATAPMKASVTYLSGGIYKTDDFYLEAGKHTFSCLNSNYLNGEYANDLTYMQFTSITGNGEIGVYSIELKEQKVYNDVVYYLENNAYKLGVKLSWGGGISYIEDKKENKLGLTNLINQCDTGRLVQQSYYGTNGDANYTAGTYNGTPWCYNPVQGGDLKQNHSRIIDIEIEERSVYIKAQPQDWALDNKLTPSYMENVYTLYSDRIQVDNRFTDFSFYSNIYRDQELPAFYTVSYLDSFVYYDGSNSWSGDSLAYEDNLPFWGDQSVRDNCLFPLRESNKETWCAWVNKTADYGIGLYVPNVDFFLAGRHSYNGSKDPMSGATNYVAPVNRMKIVSCDPIEYSYIISTGSVNEMRDTFKSYKNFAKNESLHKNYQSLRIPDANKNSLSFDFSDKTNMQYLAPLNATNISYDASNKALKLEATGPDVQTYFLFDKLSFKPDADNYTSVTIEYMIPSSNQNGKTGFEMFLCTGDTVMPEGGKSITGKYVCDGAFHTVTIDLSNISFWQGQINNIRFDYQNGSASGDVMYIKSIVFN